MSRDDRGKVAFFPSRVETIDPLRTYNLASVNLHTRDSSLGSINRSFRVDLIHLARGILSTTTCGSNIASNFYLFRSSRKNLHRIHHRSNPSYLNALFTTQGDLRFCPIVLPLQTLQLSFLPRFLTIENGTGTRSTAPSCVDQGETTHSASNCMCGSSDGGKCSLSTDYLMFARDSLYE